MSGSVSIRYENLRIGHPRTLFCVALSAAVLVICQAPADAASCESLSRLKLPGTEVTSAITVPAGGFISPEPKVSKDAAERYQKLPAFCRVLALSLIHI